MDLDELDLRLIAALEVDARQSIAKLSGRVGASRPTVRWRLQGLLDERSIVEGLDLAALLPETTSSCSCP